MYTHNIDQCFYENQEEVCLESKIVCFLCQGQHGNNTLCQMSFVEQGGIE